MANVLEDYTLLQYGDVKELKIKLMSENYGRSGHDDRQQAHGIALFSRCRMRKRHVGLQKQGYSAFWAKNDMKNVRKRRKKRC